MNKSDNKRKEHTKQAIQKSYMNLVATTKNVDSITVSDICKKAGINRTTFYSHYIDLDDLIQSIYEWMMGEFLNVFKDETTSLKHSFDFEKLFINIKENQLFYKLYFKLGFDFKNIFASHSAADISNKYFKNNKYLDYHIDFFAAGITAIIQKWLARDCKESPKVMAQIIADEYQKDNTYEE